MSPSIIQADRERPDNVAHWAQPVSRLNVSDVPSEALNLTVEGHQVAGALQGFGPMWQKTYGLRLSGVPVTPAGVVRTWKENFPKFWPTGHRFYDSMTGIAPGDVAVLNLAGPSGVTGPGGLPLISTGIMVSYADDEFFTFMSAEGQSLMTRFILIDGVASPHLPDCRSTNPALRFQAFWTAPAL